MDDSFAPTWALRFAAGCASLAVLSYLFGGPGTGLLTGAFAAAFLAVSVYLLYEWRRNREDPPRNGGDGGDDEEHRAETNAEPSGYGGNSGGL